MRLQLDLLDEVKATAEQRIAQYQDLMAKHYNSQVKVPLKTLPKGSSALTRRGLTRLRHGRGKAPTT